MRVDRGATSGHLTVISDAPTRINGRAFWLCQCGACGSEKLIYRGSLSNQSSRSCGCVGRRVEMTGKRFGRLVVVRRTDRRMNKQIVWECKCDCGGVIFVPGATLRDGRTRSCGCLRYGTGEDASAYKHGGAVGHALAPEYRVWRSLKKRCTNPNDAGYANYGARGILVCERWMDYRAFLADMGPRPSPKHSIDRIDNDGDYEPGNCRWATKAEQAQNRRTTQLDIETVLRIKERSRNGVRIFAIAKELGIDKGLCRLVVRGATWSNIEERHDAAI